MASAPGGQGLRLPKERGLGGVGRQGGPSWGAGGCQGLCALGGRCDCHFHGAGIICAEVLAAASPRPAGAETRAARSPLSLTPGGSMDDVTPFRLQRKGCDGQPPAPSCQPPQGAGPSPRTPPTWGLGARSRVSHRDRASGNTWAVSKIFWSARQGACLPSWSRPGWPRLGCRSQCPRAPEQSAADRAA